MDGFFDSEETHVERRKTISSCGSCGLYKTCISPKMKVGGEGKRGILIIAEAPGKQEDEENDQLVGMAGRFLKRCLKKEGINLNRDCWKINAVNCRPPSNRTLKDTEIEACRPRVWKAIDKLNPKIILVLGGPALKSIIGHRWKKNLGGISKWRGWAIPDRDVKAWVCPTFHPSFVIRNDIEYKGENYNVARVIFQNDLHNAIQKIRKTFPLSKDDTKRITKLTKEKEIIQYLRIIIKHEPPEIAIDYETTGLKPHRKGQEVVACSISTTQFNSTAFLITKKTIPYMQKILRNKRIRKILTNQKFEKLWSRVFFGCKMLGVYADTMEMAHILDNRTGITGVKFQTYVRLGVINYNSFVDPFIKPKKKGGNAFNTIHKMKIDSLLTYVGLDTMYEYQIAIQQLRELGIKRFT